VNETGNGHPGDRLSEYLDDQLDVAARASVDRHLAACEHCREALEALRRLARAVADEESPPVPLDLAARIARSVDAAMGGRPRRRGFVLPATIAATIAAIGILVALEWREGRLGTPAVSVPEEKTRAFEERKPVNAPATTVEPETASPAPRKVEVTPRDVLEKDVKRSAAPVVEERLKEKAEGVPGGPAGAASRVVNEDVGLAPRPATPAANTDAVSLCEYQWSDSGLRGNWEVPDAGSAAQGLGRIAEDVGGIGLWRGIAAGRPYVLVVPRDRFEEVFYALRARGVAGLVAPPSLAEGVECAGISVALTVVAGDPPPARR